MNKIIWLNPNEYEKQEYKELRLYAPKSEKILLDFNPLKISDDYDWDPKWEEWHCYYRPLRIYKQDYELLLDYFYKVLPTRHTSDGKPNPIFDVCFTNFIEKEDWDKLIYEIEQDFDNINDDDKKFFEKFIEWVQEALKHTSVIIVEGNQ